MTETILYAMYDDDEVLKDGAKKLVAKGIKITEVFFNEDQNFVEFKQNVIFYGKNSKFPNIMDD